MSRPKLLTVVQRYGDGIAGGAEAHARDLVNHLKPHMDIEVLTTTAADYRTWENAFTAGIDWVDDVPVRRFPVLRGRAFDFKLYEHRAFALSHTLEDERTFLDAQGPYAPDLLEHLWRVGKDADHLLFFTYIYYPTARGLPLVPDLAVLVPTAHDEPAIRLSIYEPVFHAPRAIAFNTEEERAMVHKRFRNERVPNDILGVGVEVPSDRSGDRFRERWGIEGDFILYIGRIVESKGCRELFRYWERFRHAEPERNLKLVLIGHPEMPIPRRDDIVHLGTVTEQEKYDALDAAIALVVPEVLSSMSMVTLEAWACGRAVICAAESPVVWGMARRARAGLAFRDAAELGEVMGMLADDKDLRERLGNAGRGFVERTYSWPRIVETYLDMFAEVRLRSGGHTIRRAAASRRGELH
jgi:glycosyltransferase involved in cell wall biosynthesis